MSAQLAEALRNMLMHIGKGREDGVEWVCEPIHSDEIKAAREALAAHEAAPQQAQAPAMSRPFDAVKSFADSVLSMLDERIKTLAQASHPFNDKFGDHPETLVAAKAQESELKEVRWQVRSLGDRALVELMKFKRPQDAQQAQAPGWQPIDETSRERVYQDGRNNYGEFVLVWGPGFDKPRRARWWWREDDQDACNFIADGGFAVFPSVWMPLPAAPQQGSKS